MQAPHTRPLDVRALQTSWQAVDTMVQLRPIRDDADYQRMLDLLNSLLEVAGEDEDHPLSSLIALAGELVSRYEETHHGIEAAAPHEALRFLMDARGLKQQDLNAIVPQSNLSAILAGKRKISATLAGKLGQFFGISPALFVPK